MTDPAAIAGWDDSLAAAEAAGERPLHRRVLGGLGWSSMGRVAALLGSVTTNALLARVLAPKDLGAYYLIAALTTILAMVSLLGLNQAVVRIVPESLTQRRPQDARSAATTCIVIGAISASVFGVILFATTRPLAEHVFGSKAMAGAAVLVGLLVPVTALRLLVPEVFRGLHDLRLASLFGDGATNVLLAIAIAVLAAVATHVRLSTVLLAWLAIALLLLASSLRRLWSTLRTLPRGPLRAFAPTLRLALPMLAASLSWSVLAQFDLLILGGFRPNSDVAYYGAADRVATLLLLPLLVTNAAVAPLIAELWFGKRHDALQHLLRGMAAVNALLCGAGLLVLIVAGGPILKLLYGGFYGRGASVLVALAAGAFVNSAAGPCGLALVLTGQQFATMVVTVSIVAATTGAVAWAASAHGALGTAVAMTCGVFAQNLAMVLLVRRRLGIWTFPSLAGLRALQLRPR